MDEPGSPPVWSAPSPAADVAPHAATTPPQSPAPLGNPQPTSALPEASSLLTFRSSSKWEPTSQPSPTKSAAPSTPTSSGSPDSLLRRSTSPSSMSYRGHLADSAATNTCCPRRRDGPTGPRCRRFRVPLTAAGSWQGLGPPDASPSL